MRYGVEPAVMAALTAQKLASAAAARQWLKEAHGVERCYGTVWAG